MGIALDVAGRNLFWTEFATGEIRRLTLDGSRPHELIADDLGGPIGLAFDAVGGGLYWTCDDTFPRKVQRSDADGSRIVDIASGASVNRPSAIAADPGGNTIFWTESVAGRIRRADLDGSDVEEIVTSGISSEHDRADAREFKALGIAVDGVNRKVYWTDMLDAQILRADVDGSNVETIVAASAGLELPAGIALQGGRIYWADAGAAKIQRANSDGSGIEDVLTAEHGLIEPYALALDAESARLYWTDASAGTISSATLGGKDVRPVVAARAGAEPIEVGSVQECSSAAAAAAMRYVYKTVNAIGACLSKIDALKAVWRTQADGARAAASCLRQFERLAGGADPASTLAGKLRATLQRDCGARLGKLASAGDGALGALLEKRCSGDRDDFERLLDCCVERLTEAAYSRVALRFHRAAEWLDDVRPFMAAAADEPAKAAAVLATLDRLHGALLAMAAPVASSSRDGTGLTVTGQTLSYAAVHQRSAGAATPIPDDGALRVGVPFQYVDNGDGTISDVRSGLMWEKKCSACGGLHDAEARHAVVQPSPEGGIAAWLAAVNGENGTGYAGHADWRLPTIKELQTIVDYERFNPAVPRAFNRSACGLGCSDLTAPECSCTGMMWHCSATPKGSDLVFALGFNLGIVGDLEETAVCGLRAVRDVGGRARLDE
jgi:sugar lactone lactonase YvrE